ERAHRIVGYQTHRPGVLELQILDDDARLDDAPIAVDEQRKLADRPAAQPFGSVVGRIRPDRAELVRSAVLVKRDEHFLCIRGEAMAVEHEWHRETPPWAISDR